MDSVQQLLDTVAGYPLTTPPDIFGLHANAAITSAQNETYSLLATLLSLQPRTAPAAAAPAPGSAAPAPVATREDTIAAACEAIAAQLPPQFYIAAVQAAYPTRYEESMNTVLAQECIRCALLLRDSAHN